jgi:hypothetical protein
MAWRPVTGRTAGLCGCVLALAAVAVYRVGLPPVYVAAYTILFLLFSTAMTRLRAQLGAPTNEMAFMGPNQLFADFHGTAGVADALVLKARREAGGQGEHAATLFDPGLELVAPHRMFDV